MNVVKCKNGHFFDGDSYPVCPHCGEGVMNVAPTPKAKEEEKKKIFSWGGKKEKNEPVRFGGTTAGNYEEYITHSDSSANDPFGKSPTDVIPSSETPEYSSSVRSDSTADHTPGKGKTVNFWGGTMESDVAIGIMTSQHSAYIEKHLEQPVPEQPIPGQTEVPENSATAEEKVPVAQATSAPLRDVVQKASANSEGKTMSYFSAANAANIANSEKSAPQPISSDPVVGWLVCIGGQHFGESFHIGAGKNSIGRGDGNRIVLGKDGKISREKHALITYEPKKRNFYLQPGDSSGLTYLNDEYIDESKKLIARDVIEIGSCRLMFVPLCDETFSWEDYLPKES